MTEYERKPKSRPTTATALLKRQGLEVQASTDKQKAGLRRGAALQQLGRSVQTQLLTSSVHRQHTAPVLYALTVQREAAADLTAQRSSLRLQIAQIQAALPEQAVQTALQRDAGPAPLPGRPSTPAHWVQAAQLEAQRVEDPERPGHIRWLSNADDGRYRRTLQVVARQLTDSFRADRGPAMQRYAEYGAHLATLHRHGLTQHIPQVFMTQIPQAERLSVQRSMDDALQRLAAQDTQDRQATALHALQRQVEDIEFQSRQPIMQRIQARAGGGTPLPEPVRRHLEAGLNHDLAGVRIHDDAEADTLAKSVQATAFTTGRDIYFQSGTFNPNTQSGLELIAHEVTHVK